MKVTEPMPSPSSTHLALKLIALSAVPRNCTTPLGVVALPLLPPEPTMLPLPLPPLLDPPAVVLVGVPPMPPMMMLPKPDDEGLLVPGAA